MHYFIIAFYLLHGYSTGYPTVDNETMNFVPSALNHLVNTCENPFLVSTIKQKDDYCKINEKIVKAEKTISQSELECFMFYDINSQLCEAFRQTEVNLQDNYNAKIKDSQNVGILCDDAKTWKFATIQKHSMYTILEKVLSDPVNCQKLCGVGDLFSDEANYYCTYFKWGNDVIKSKIQTVHQEASKILPASDSAVKSAVAPSLNNTNVPIVTNNSGLKPVDSNLSLKPDETTKEGTNPSKVSQVTQSTSSQKSDIVIEKTPETNNSQKVIEQPPASAQEVPPKKDDVDVNDQQLQVPQKLLDKSKDILNEDSNPEDDENDDVEYGQPDELVQEEAKKQESGVVEPDPDVVLKEKNNNKVEAPSAISNRQPLHRDFIQPVDFQEEDIKKHERLPPNTIQDSFTDDDDHFFPIFLTAIIIVVLLYILYHNKNKFTKVILGLLVEGRQSGRRRNSRGHAYRRLDTLEQAMSSNTAAPPSKIIY